ncbi:MAG TPA: hypothetical protein VNA21_07445 [Steroidobacteraceae bacterium]|nr:hypothetical protein [Steroidobacteraceae bacterium]
MKVHLLQLSKVIDKDPKQRGGQVVQFTRAKLIAQVPIITDGPFTESKESCSHVAILSRCLVQARR